MRVTLARRRTFGTWDRASEAEKEEVYPQMTSTHAHAFEYCDVSVSALKNFEVLEVQY